MTLLRDWWWFRFRLFLQILLPLFTTNNFFSIWWLRTILIHFLKSLIDLGGFFEITGFYYVKFFLDNAHNFWMFLLLVSSPINRNKVWLMLFIFFKISWFNYLEISMLLIMLKASLIYQFVNESSASSSTFANLKIHSFPYPLDLIFLMNDISNSIDSIISFKIWYWDYLSYVFCLFKKFIL